MEDSLPTTNILSINDADICSLVTMNQSSAIVFDLYVLTTYNWFSCCFSIYIDYRNRCPTPIRYLFINKDDSFEI